MRLHRNGEDIHHFARIASFAEYAVIPESGAVPVREDMPLDKASLVGCSVMTGVGAVVNTAKVEPGAKVVVIGCGGVGLNCVQGAQLAGAEQIVAVDTKANKLDYARTFGATDTINSSNATNEEVVERIQELTRGRAGLRLRGDRLRTDHPPGLRVHPAPAAPRWSSAWPPENDEITLNALSIPRTEKIIMGSWYGSAKAWTDLPRMCDLYLAGRLNLDDLVSRSYPLEEINEAYDALAAGDVARSIIEFA